MSRESRAEKRKMELLTDISPYRELLRRTEEVLQCLEEGEDEKLAFLLDERRNAFMNICRGGTELLPRDTASWIRRIRECEDRCTSLAKAKKDGIQQELQAIRNKERLGHIYGNQS